MSRFFKTLQGSGLLGINNLLVGVSSRGYTREMANTIGDRRNANIFRAKRRSFRHYYSAKRRNLRAS